jgi:hypothetical protein
MRNGSCTTSPSISPDFSAWISFSLLSKPTKVHLARAAAVLQRAQHPEGGRLVRAEDPVQLLVILEQVLGLAQRGLGRGPRVLIARHHRDAGNSFWIVSRNPFSRSIVLAEPSW